MTTTTETLARECAAIGLTIDWQSSHMLNGAVGRAKFRVPLRYGGIGTIGVVVLAWPSAATEPLGTYHVSVAATPSFLAGRCILDLGKWQIEDGGWHRQFTATPVEAARQLQSTLRALETGRVQTPEE